ncbi:MAG: hypothetical protein HN849_06625 [Victivallales bacterium]|jgi:hypothetical protein|nr:hypothetical protein [Victivallales bacterium]MBT7299165.1 hypothetical protein [Victivallales bacterium]
MKINISHRVKLFPQPTGMTCWSAAATMLFGDRSVGSGKATVGAKGGLDSSTSNVQLFAKAHGLKMHPLQSLTTEGLANRLRRGPLWVAGAVPKAHAYVIAAMQGDGTADKTFLTLYDPWPPKIGRIRKNVAYGAWMRKYPLGMVYMLQR